MEEKDKKFIPPEIDSPKKFFLGKNKKQDWTENSFVFDAAAGKQVAIPKSGRFVGNSVTQKTKKFLIIFVGGILAILLVRILYLQILQGHNFLASAEQNRQRIISVPSERGLLYDRNGVQLTKNIPKFSLTLVPQDLPRDITKREKIIRRLSELTGQGTKEIRATLEEYGSYSYESIVIKENLDYDQALLIHIAASDLPGIKIGRGSKRLYTLDTSEEGSTTSTESNLPLSLSHILGYEGKLNKQELDEFYDQGYLPSDSIGKAGIERFYESYVRGVYGKKRIEVDAYGREQTALAEEDPVPGSHIVLSIDIEMQKKLEEILQDHLDKNKLSRGSGIVMNPKNGEILAMVSLPSYNNNDFSGGISQENYSKYIENENHPLFNRAIAGTYPSGSTIKPAVAAAALQEGIIKPNTSFRSVGGIQVGPWFFPDWQAGGHGITNVRKSIAWSVNTFYYYIGGGHNDFVGLGVEKIKNYLEEFGFAKKLGVDIPSEASGFIPSIDWKQEKIGEGWYVGDTYNLSIGQGYLLVTPLQIANLTATIANGGKVYRPHFAKKIIDPLTKEENDLKPEILNEQVVDAPHIQTVRLGMKDCVDYGSCRYLSLLPFSIAGKTGTAQWSSKKENHAWFTSFAPFNNPQIVVTILVEEGGQGSDIAVPIAFDFYNWWQGG